MDFMIGGEPTMDRLDIGIEATGRDIQRVVSTEQDGGRDQDEKWT